MVCPRLDCGSLAVQGHPLIDWQACVSVIYGAIMIVISSDVRYDIQVHMHKSDLMIEEKTTFDLCLIWIFSVQYWYQLPIIVSCSWLHHILECALGFNIQLQPVLQIAFKFKVVWWFCPLVLPAQSWAFPGCVMMTRPVVKLYRFTWGVHFSLEVYSGSDGIFCLQEWICKYCIDTGATACAWNRLTGLGTYTSAVCYMCLVLEYDWYLVAGWSVDKYHIVCLCVLHC